MKTKFKIFILITLLAVFVFPLVSQAALVPCGRSDQGGTMCTLCDLIVGFQGIIDFGFKIMVIVAIAMIMISGIIYIVSAGSTSMMETAKGLLKNVLIGFSVILAGWLIINTLMWVMGTKGDLGIGVISWNQFTCTR